MPRGISSLHASHLDSASILNIKVEITLENSRTPVVLQSMRKCRLPPRLTFHRQLTGRRGAALIRSPPSAAQVGQAPRRTPVPPPVPSRLQRNLPPDTTFQTLRAPHLTFARSIMTEAQRTPRSAPFLGKCLEGHSVLDAPPHLFFFLNVPPPQHVVYLSSPTRDQIPCTGSCSVTKVLSTGKTIA